MDWFGKDGEREAAAAQAVRMAERLTLPVEARSLSRAELVGRQRRVVLVMAIGLAVITIALLAAVAGEARAAPVKALAILAPVALIGGPTLWIAVRWHRQRSHGYEDPGLTVRVEADGLVVADATGSHALGWPPARIESFTGRGGIQFLGATVASPFGAIRLDEDYYRNGRNAAAAFLRAATLARDAAERAKVERIG